MNNINLLPWREEQRLRDDKKLLTNSIAFWVGCLALVFLMLFSASKAVKNQDNRNQFLIEQNAKLTRQISDIEQLKEDKAQLLSRINLVQNLQANRMQIVHVFDDIVRKLPSGVTLDQLSKKDSQILFSGKAQSNARVSELMNRLDSSQWFGRSDLSVVNVTDSENNKLSQFELVVTEKDLTSTENGINNSSQGVN